MDFILTPFDGNSSRFADFRQMVTKFYEWKWGHECPWDGAEGRQLSQLLKSSPSLDVMTFKRWLYNYGMSEDITPGERPRSFLPRIHNYSVVPLDRFKRSQDAQIDTAQTQRARRNSAAFEQARQDRRIAEHPSPNLPEQRTLPRRNPALASGFRRLSSGSD